MQIDFHHAGTYVAARNAGFEHKEAATIAYAAQYVDDATCNGAVRFDNRAIYQRICSAHKTIDLHNLDAVEDLLVWMPFHFLPGNGGADPGDDPEGSFIHKLITRPDSPIARDMVRAAILDQDKPYALHRLGITMHVYADTWAHQGFAGVIHKANEISDFTETDGSGLFDGGLQEFVADLIEDIVPPLGHGQASIFPDMPFLAWEYTNGDGNPIKRNNTEIFCSAANALCMAMQRYRLGDPDAPVAGMAAADLAQMRQLFSSCTKTDGDVRHRVWLDVIASGLFSFGPAAITYADDGEGSWKAAALGDSVDRDECHEYPYRDSFLTSDWKYFHDALQLHRITVAHDILPRYGICAA